MSGFWTAVAAVVVGAGGLAYQGYTANEANMAACRQRESSGRSTNSNTFKNR